MLRARFRIRRSHHRFAQRPDPRDGHARRAAGTGEDLLSAVSVAIFGVGEDDGMNRRFIKLFL